MRRRTSYGNLLATVAMLGCWLVSCFTPVSPGEQRERLPPAAVCADPIEGLWMAYAYQVDDDHWMLNKMELRRSSSDPSAYASRFETHTWTGGVGEDDPPDCRQGVARTISRSSGVAHYRDGVLVVRGTELGPLEQICGHETPDRALGVLTGRVSLRRHEFLATMTTKFGSQEIVWRRVRCLDSHGSP